MNKADPKHGAARPESSISENECRAIRELDEDDGWTRTEIAMVMECKPGTVRRHADRDCRHQAMSSHPFQPKQYDREDCLKAYRIVYDRQPYEDMSSGVYDDVRPDDFPSSGTISRVVGSWQKAREAIRGESDA